MFKDIADDEILAACRDAKTVTLKAGETLFREGDDAHAMYVVKQGTLRISHSERQHHSRNGSRGGHRRGDGDHRDAHAAQRDGDRRHPLRIGRDRRAAVSVSGCRQPGLSIAVLRVVSRRLRVMNRRYRVSTR